MINLEQVTVNEMRFMFDEAISQRMCGFIIITAQSVFMVGSSENPGRRKKPMFCELRNLTSVFVKRTCNSNIPAYDPIEQNG